MDPDIQQYFDFKYVEGELHMYIKKEFVKKLMISARDLHENEMDESSDTENEEEEVKNEPVYSRDTKIENELALREYTGSFLTSSSSFSVSELSSISFSWRSLAEIISFFTNSFLMYMCSSPSTYLKSKYCCMSGSI
jgi:hypothetical protein